MTRRNRSGRAWSPELVAERVASSLTAGDDARLTDIRTRGACAGMSYDDPDLFFPVSRHDQRRITRAKGVCAGCPVLSACASYGMEEPYGVWGGLTEWERSDIRARHSRQAAELERYAANHSAAEQPGRAA